MLDFVRFSYLCIAVIINVLYGIVVSLKYKVIVNRLGEKTTIVHSFLIFCITKIASFFTPFNSGSTPIRTLAAKYYDGLPIRKGILVSLFSEIFDLVWQIILLVILLVLLGQELVFSKIWGTSVIFSLGILVIILIIKYYKNIMPLIDKIHNKSPKLIKNIFRKLKIDSPNLNRLFEESGSLFLHKPLLFKLIILTLIQILIIPFILIFIALSFGFQLSFFNAFSIYFISVLLGRISGLPGGLIISDISMATLFGLTTSIPYSEILKIIVVYRIVALAPNFIIGIVPFFKITKGLGKDIRNVFKTN